MLKSRPVSPILIASADPGLNNALAELLSEHAPAISSARPPLLAQEVGERADLELLVVGETSTDSSALDLLQTIRELYPDLAVLVVSTHPTIEHATDSIRRGAEDFVPVPYSGEIVRKEVARILEAAELRKRVASLDRLVASRFGFERIVSESRRMQPVFERARAAARSETPVLVLGETGTGKELIARAIHSNSRRAKRSFVAVNCAAFPHDLVESELFGHRRGAFSGATADHLGLFAAANGGSLFLDEVGDLPLDVQAKLLRVLQDGEVRPVGGLESRQVNVRIIAATNRPITDLRTSRMRQDLFFRLSVMVIDIPPLRERREDLPSLISHFLAQIRDRGGRRIEALDQAALEALDEYAFPGNVRELQNMLESIAIGLPPERSTIRVEDVRAWFHRRGIGDAERTRAAAGDALNLAKLETWAIAEALHRAKGNKSLAAHILGISRDTLYRKLREHHLTDSRT